MFSINESININQILIIDDNYEMYTLLKDLFNDDFYYNLIYSSSDDYINRNFSNISLIILNADNQNKDIFDLINEKPLKYLSNLIPIIVMSDNDRLFFKMTVMKELGFFIHKSYNNEYLYNLIKRISNLYNINKFSNSLSGIPSSISINKELIKRFNSEESFSFMYIDLDNFKSFNDNYGYLRGNDAILGLADIIFKTIDNYGDENDFIGHIGGDDFVAIVNRKNDEIIANDIIKSFEIFAKKMYDPGESFLRIIEKMSPNGFEKMQIMSVSIAIVSYEPDKNVSINEFLETIIETKKKAKSIEGNISVKIEV